MLLLIVTLVSMLLAAIMSVAAWRIAVQERRRSEARVDALAAEIHDVPAPGVRVSPYRLDDDLELRPVSGTAARSELFAAARPAGSRSRLAVVVAIGVFVFGAAVSLAIVLSAGSRGLANPPAADAVATPPLELVALGHERDGDRLTVRGVVRNPATGARLDDLSAVVILLNREGGVLASARATVESAPLGPGGESAFVVTVAGATDVGRFRVSFRTDDHVVPHIDKRHES